MTPTPRRSDALRRRLLAALATTLWLGAAGPVLAMGIAEPPRYVWDIDPLDAGSQTGAGTWNTDPASLTFIDAALNINPGPTSPNFAWDNTNGAIAVFGAASLSGATVTVDVVTAAGLHFDASYTLTAGTITLTGDPDIYTKRDATVASSLDGSVGFTKTGEAQLTLSGNNAFTGGVTVSQGTLNLSNASALAAGNTATVENAATLKLSAITLDRSIELLDGAMLDSSGVAAAIGPVNYSGAVRLRTASAGSLTLGDSAGEFTGDGSLRTEGAGTVILNHAPALVGSVAVAGGTLRLANSATLANALSIEGGTLELDNSAALNTDRVAGAVTARGGGLTLKGNAAATSETIASLTLDRGRTTLTNTPGAGGSILTLASLTRAIGGGVLTFAGTLNTAISQIQVPTALDAGGMLGAWATVGTEFAAKGANGVLAFNSYNTADLDTLALTAVAKPGADEAALTANRTIHALNLTSGRDVNMADFTLALVSGALYKTGSTGSLLTNGQLTAGNSAADAELLITVGDLGGSARTLTIGSATLGQEARLVNNLAGGSVHLTKAGNGTLTLVNDSSFTGNVAVLEGTLELQHALAVNARPITLAGGSLTLRSASNSDFASDVAVNANATLTVHSAAHQIGAMTVNSGASLTIAPSGTGNRSLTVAGLTHNGAITINSGGGLRVTDSYSGAGDFRLAQSNQSKDFSNWTLRMDELSARGVQFLGDNKTWNLDGNVAATNSVADPILGVQGAGSVLYYNGFLQGAPPDASGNDTLIVVRGGARWVFDDNARINNNQPDLINARGIYAVGDGLNNIIEFSEGFRADNVGTDVFPRGGLSTFRFGNITWITHHTESLPSLWKFHGNSGVDHHGLLAFDLHNDTTWSVRTNAHEYDGQVTFRTNTTLDVQTQLDFIGDLASKAETYWAIPTGYSPTITKTGVGDLNMHGYQGYAGGTYRVEQGGLNFTRDPGEGWMTGSYTRDANGDVNSTPVYTPNLNIVALGSDSRVGFGALLNGINALTLSDGATAAVKDLPGSPVGDKQLNTWSMAVTSGTATMNVEAGHVGAVGGGGLSLSASTLLNKQGLGLMVVGNLSWGDASELRVQTGTLELAPANPTSVGAVRPTLRIVSGAVATATSGVDAFGGANPPYERVRVINDSMGDGVSDGLVIVAGTQSPDEVIGTGSTKVEGGATLVTRRIRQTKLTIGGMPPPMASMTSSEPLVLGGGVGGATGPAVPLPEPGAGGLMLAAGAMLLGRRRRKVGL